MTSSRTERIRRVLANEPEAELELWLAVGAQAAADPARSDLVRAAAAEQVAVCREMLARRAQRRGAGGPPATLPPLNERAMSA
jgi:hypothetical protein